MRIGQRVMASHELRKRFGRYEGQLPPDKIGVITEVRRKDQVQTGMFRYRVAWEHEGGHLDNTYNKEHLILVDFNSYLNQIEADVNTINS